MRTARTAQSTSRQRTSSASEILAPGRDQELRERSVVRRAAVEIAPDLGQPQVVLLHVGNRQVPHAGARVDGEQAPPLRLAESDRQHGQRVVDRLRRQLSGLDALGESGEPLANKRRVDRVKPQLAEERQQPLPPVRLIVLERARAHVVPPVGQERRPPRGERVAHDLDLATADRFLETTLGGRCGATAVEPASVGHRPVRLPKGEAPAGADRRLVGVDAACGRRR
jgi:hypothetical protein